jgi:hypothetical protein
LRKRFVQPADPDEWEKREALRANNRLSSGNYYLTTGVQGSTGVTGPQGSSGIPTGGMLRGFSANASTACYSASVGQSISTMDSMVFGSSEPLLEEGITVKGSVSNQSFKETRIRELEVKKHVIILRLRGTVPGTDSVAVEHPLTTKDKLKCTTCGKVGSSADSYCRCCGAALIVKIGA